MEGWSNGSEVDSEDKIEGQRNAVSAEALAQEEKNGRVEEWMDCGLMEGWTNGRKIGWMEYRQWRAFGAKIRCRHPPF